jgi:two-component system alkaline phosphatase synthesis response regulator PhoP
MVEMSTYIPLSAQNDISVVGDLARGTPARVLVVDDDRSIRETLRYVLEDEGYIVVEAPDGVAALELLRSSPSPSVVLLDLMMPRLDGVGVLSAVMGDQQLASQNAYIVITANLYRLDNKAAHLLDDLGVPVVPKPFDMDTLLDKVASAARKVTHN